MIQMLTKSILFLLILTSQAVDGQDKIFTSSQIKEDLVNLEMQLRKYHPNLYSYSSQAEFKSYFSKLNKELPERVNESEAFRIIAHTSSIIMDGHTYFYPNPQNRPPTKKDLTFFPISIHWDGTKLFVLKNLSENDEIYPGQEIVSINGIRASQIANTMISNLSRDGENLNYPTWVMNSFFRAFYGYQFGYPNQFNLTLKLEDQVTEANINALSSSQINANRKMRTDSNSNTKSIFPISYKLDIPEKAAILKILDWHKFSYRDTKFKKEIKALFKKIKAQSIDKLIIDIRGNQGGSIDYSKFLLRRLLDQPFTIVDSYRKVDADASESGPYKLKTVKQKYQGVIKPLSNNFKGEVIVLIDGGCFSNSAIFSSVLQENKRAYFIGEETGGSATLLAGGSKKVWLPHTKIEVQIPALQYNLHNRTTHKGGVVPDKKVRPTIRELIACEDPALQLALEK